MKNTKSRKKILLSSIAMLLVALVALGSATYAWFTINKTVEAKQINVKASVANGLVINNTVTPNWQRTVSFDAAATEIKPVSYHPVDSAAFPAGYYPVDVAAQGEYNATGFNGSKTADHFTAAPAIASVSNTAGDKLFGAGDYVAHYQVQIKSSDDAEINQAVKVTITETGAAAAGKTKTGDTFAKAALMPAQATNAPTDYAAGDVIALAGDAYKGITADTPTVSTDNFVPNASNVNVLTKVAASTTYTYDLYVWFEGNDSDCVDDGQLATASFELKFELV